MKTVFQPLYDHLKPTLKRLLNKASFWLNHSMSHQSVVKRYLHGSGIEVGALHNPLQVPPAVNVKYVDRLSVADLRKQYPELAQEKLVNVDIVDDGEELHSIADHSQDFVIAHQFIEHCQNPIRAIENMLRVLKPDGILYLSIPDKRHNFDAHRPVTDIQHLLKDYKEGPEWSRYDHYQEWATFVNLGYTEPPDPTADPRIAAETDRLMQMDYSIHFHVWTQTEVFELLPILQKTLNFPFEVEVFLKNFGEVILVLRKL